MKNIIVITILVVLVISLGFLIFKPKGDQKVLGDSIDVSYTLSDLITHSSIDDCWTVIDNGVYDLTKFISNHPGGEKILNACGKNATDLFNGSDPIGRMHSAVAKNLLSGMKIGNFKSN